jgi:glutamyl-tRNA(Gln) amidotransferase subunit D
MSLEGYRGRALKTLKRAGASVGDDVLVRMSGRSVEGVLMPRYQYSDDTHIVVKLKNGYNVGISVEKVLSITVKGRGKEPAFIPPAVLGELKGLPKVVLVGTGGTIASRIDYRTGGVRPALTSEEIYHLVPELASIAQISTQVPFSIYSENMTPELWGKLALVVGEAVRAGSEGVVVTMGTDTMHYTAAALAFALQSLPIPVVIVGSQRSSDRPSSDSAVNLIAAVRFAATAPVSGVYVAMHSGPGDDEVSIHSSVRVRKLHTSRRDAFKTVGSSPVATVRGSELALQKDLPPRLEDRSRFRPAPEFSPEVAMLKVHPGFRSSLIRHLVDSGVKGIVLEGTGLGHTPKSSYDDITYAIRRGTIVTMTSQCIFGSVRMTVYETGRDLLNMGVVPLGDMLSEVALAKLSWLLGQGHELGEVATLMVQNLVGEITERRTL